MFIGRKVLDRSHIFMRTPIRIMIPSLLFLISMGLSTQVSIPFHLLFFFLFLYLDHSCIIRLISHKMHILT